MPKVTDEALNKSLKAGDIKPLYLFYGAETRLLQNTVSRIVDQVVEPAFEAFNLQRFEEGCTPDELQTAYEALPMMASQKAVVVRDWDLGSANKAAQETVLAMLEDPNPSTVLIFYYTDGEYDPVKKAASKKLLALIEKQGTVCAFNLKDKATLKKALAARCKQAGVTIDPMVCDMVIERCGLSYGQLQTEIDKLIAYADGGEITAAAVEALCVQTFQNTVFELSDAILRGQVERAYRVLDHLMDQQVKPQQLIAPLTTGFGDLYRAKAGQVAGHSLQDVANDFKYGRASFRITKHRSEISKYSIDRVRFCVLKLEEANRLMFSTRADDRVLLEKMIGEMLACRR